MEGTISLIQGDKCVELDTEVVMRDMKSMFLKLQFIKDDLYETLTLIEDIEDRYDLLYTAFKEVNGESEDKKDEE